MTGLPDPGFGLAFTGVLDNLFMGDIQVTPLFHVGIDASGAIDQNNVAVAFGVVGALTPRWHAFQAPWVELLKEHDIGYLKVSEAMAFRGEFEGKQSAWGADAERRRDHLLQRAAMLAHKYLGAGGVSYTWGEHLPTDKKIRYRKNLMFQALVMQMLSTVPSSYSLLFLCDSDQDVAVQFYHSIERFKRTQQSLAHRLGGLCFLDDRRITQLQAADLVAYVLRERQGGRTNTLTEILFTGPDHVDLTMPVRFSLPKNRQAGDD